MLTSPSRRILSLQFVARETRASAAEALAKGSTKGGPAAAHAHRRYVGPCHGCRLGQELWHLLIGLLQAMWQAAGNSHSCHKIPHNAWGMQAVQAMQQAHEHAGCHAQACPDEHA